VLDLSGLVCCMGQILRRCIRSEARTLKDVCSSKYIDVDLGKRSCKAGITNADGSIAEDLEYDNKLTVAEIFT
jgi:hypothetical protein